MKKLLVLTAILGAFSASLFAEEVKDEVIPQESQEIQNNDANSQVAVEEEAKQETESK